MKTGVWLRRVGRFRVEHLPYPYLTGAVDLAAPAKGLLHTTEGPTIEGALSVFRQHYAPNFTVGPDAKGKVRVLQHAPLGVMGQALKNAPGGVETNRIVRAQIEIVGFSLTRRWLPAPDTRDALLALMHVLERHAEIPHRHVRVDRRVSRWLVASGWVGHVDVPENDHVDPGAFDYPRAFRLMDKTWHDVAPVRARPRAVDRARLLPLRLRARKAEPSSCHLA